MHGLVRVIVCMLHVMVLLCGYSVWFNWRVAMLPLFVWAIELMSSSPTHYYSVWSDQRVQLPIIIYVDRGRVQSLLLPYDVLLVDWWRLHARLYNNWSCYHAMFYNHSELVALCDIVCLKPMNLTNIMLTFLSIIFRWAF